MNPAVRTGLAIAIFLITLALIMLRPRGLSEATAALAGGVAMLGIGAVSVTQAATVLATNWDVFLFFLGLLSIAALAERSGFFDWAAAVAARLAGGSELRLYLNVMLLGVAISTLFSNDATALILTPIVYALVTRLRLAALPFMFACTFIADTASFVLPVSNPINILVLNSFRVDLGQFLRLMLLPSVLAIALNIGLFVLVFRSRLGGRFVPKELGTPTQFIRDARYFHYVCAVLCLLALGYVAAAALSLPLSPVALAAAALLLAGALFRRLATVRGVAGDISWPIFGFVAGMFVVVRGIEQVGVTQQLAGWLRILAATGSPVHRSLTILGAVLVSTFGSAIGSNLINNLPMAVVMTSTIRQFGPVSQAAHLALVGGTMFGCDLGPNITTVGSLATILWLLLLRRRGVDVSALDYFRLGIVVAPVMLLAGALAMWLSLRM